MPKSESENKVKFKRIMLWILVILGMGIIYFLSSQTASESNGLSGQTIQTLLKIFMPEIGKLPPAEQMEIVAGLQSVVRDAAHVITYILLGILCMAALLTYEWEMKARILTAFFIGAEYAVFDELHQVFVSGRAFQFYDIGLDCCGLLLGILIVAGLHCIRKAINGRGKA